MSKKSTRLKKIAALLIAAAAVSVSAYAADGITVKLNGELLEFDVQPRIINERTMVPMRKIFEELGAQVEWVPEEQMIIAAHGSELILLQIGESAVIKRDMMTGEMYRTELDISPCIIEDRTFVPLRAVSETLGAEVTWDGETGTVFLSSGTAK